jgi:outer membrane beta-barrel protein
MSKHTNSFLVPASVLLLTLAFVNQTSAADKLATGSSPGSAAPATQEDLRVAPSERDEAGTLPEKIDVQTMKRRYWTVGNEDLMSVVQNRLYTKKGRGEFALGFGFYSDDPFISANSVSGRFGYHLNETISIHAFFAKIRSSYSSAYSAAKRDTYTPVVNPAKSVMGAEARYSAIYGKLSILGKSIIYYDFSLSAGVSQIKTNADSPIAPVLGLGQQIFLSKKLFMSMDYRLMYHSEKFPVAGGSRSLWTNWIQIGLGSFLF